MLIGTVPGGVAVTTVQLYLPLLISCQPQKSPPSKSQLPQPISSEPSLQSDLKSHTSVELIHAWSLLHLNNHQENGLRTIRAVILPTYTTLILQCNRLHIYIFFACSNIRNPALRVYMDTNTVQLTMCYKTNKTLIKSVSVC